MTLADAASSSYHYEPDMDVVRHYGEEEISHAKQMQEKRQREQDTTNENTLIPDANDQFSEQQPESSHFAFDAETYKLPTIIQSSHEDGKSSFFALFNQPVCSDTVSDTIDNS
ncbi:hypothetical protein G6F68_017010 [Rhizopus microsporus]|nr:hypothetical protein G6F68_017010 [Rhizopus microsporus]